MYTRKGVRGVRRSAVVMERRRDDEQGLWRVSYKGEYREFQSLPVALRAVAGLPKTRLVVRVR